MPTSKLLSFHQVKKLKFRRSPELKAKVIKIGLQVQKELEKEERRQPRRDVGRILVT